MVNKNITKTLSKTTRIYILVTILFFIALVIGAIFIITNLTNANEKSQANNITQHLTTIPPAEDDYLNTIDLKQQTEIRFKVAQEKENSRIAAKKAADEVAAKEVVRLENERLAAEEIAQLEVEKSENNETPILEHPEVSVENPLQEDTPPIVQAPAAPEPVVQAPANAQIYVGLSGGQDVIDSCGGPVLFNAPTGYPYIAEHENCGGWARFSGLTSGVKVTLSGLVSGTYTVGTIINTPKGSNSTVLSALGSPAAVLQTCIPGTNTMVVIGLY